METNEKKALEWSQTLFGRNIKRFIPFKESGKRYVYDPVIVSKLLEEKGHTPKVTTDVKQSRVYPKVGYVANSFEQLLQSELSGLQPKKVSPR